jgi:hypothetical protein
MEFMFALFVTLGENNCNVIQIRTKRPPIAAPTIFFAQGACATDGRSFTFAHDGRYFMGHHYRYAPDGQNQALSVE